MNKNKANLKDSKNKKSSNEISQPHDITFKKLFGEVKIARDVIEKNLPREVLEQLDMNSLKRLDASFISETLKETFSDLLYGVRINNRDAYIALLWEHKSKADKLAVFQVAGYILDIWKRIIKEGKKELPLVIPIVVYHGKGAWNYKTDIREMISDFDTFPDYLKQMLPVIKHEFINITAYTEEDIQEYEPITRMAIRSFKYIFWDKNDLIKAFLISVDEIQPFLTDEELSRYIDILLIYYSAANKNLTEEDIIQKIKELGGKGAKVMTILQEREQKGIQYGIEQGIEQGMLEERKKSARMGITKGYDMQVIMDITGLTEDEIQEIKEKMLS